MSTWDFRLAKPAESEAFAKWSLENPQIDPKDRAAGEKKNNPTVLYFVVTKDGVPQAFAPVYLQMILAHLVFNPNAHGKEKLTALQMLMDGVSAMAVQYGVREIVTLSKVDYPVGKWAVKHDFEVDPRQLFKLDLNRLMASGAVPPEESR